MIATLDKCNVQDDDVSYTCDGPKSLCDKLMKQMNGYSTDYLYSSLPEKKDQDDSDQDDYEDDCLTIIPVSTYTKLSSFLSLHPVTNPVSTQLPSSNITRQRNEMTNNNEVTSAIETVENFRSSSSHRSTIEFVTSTDLNVQVSNRSNETSINLPSNPMVSPVPAAPGISQINRSNKNTSTNQKTHRKQAPVPLLSSSSSNNISPSERLANIEEVLDNLSICVNTLGEDVASIILQLNSFSKMIKIIQNHVMPSNPVNLVSTSPSLRNSTILSPSSTIPSNQIAIFKDTNLMHFKHDLTSIRSFLRKMTMGVYKRGEILSNKHFDDQDDRYVAIETMSTLRPSLKEARTQLTKDVRYLKVMKPKATDADSNENHRNDTTDLDDQAIQLLDERRCLYDE
ncbi:unnamed protein product [Rotaria magnacalcarata]